MKRTEKSAIVERLAKQLGGAATIYATDFTGVAVKPMTDLRDRLRAAGVGYTVVKNTLALRAMQEAAVEGLEDVLTGPTGFVFAADDPVTAAKVLADFGREHDGLTVKAGVVDGRRMSAEDVARLASLPSRDQLLAQAAGYLEAPLQGFVGVLNGMLTQVVGALEALRDQRASA